MYMTITAYDECWVHFHMSKMEAKLEIIKHLSYHLWNDWDYVQKKILSRLDDKRVKVADLIPTTFIEKNDLMGKNPEEVAMLYRKMVEVILDLIEEGFFKDPKGSCSYTDIIEDIREDAGCCCVPVWPKDEHDMERIEILYFDTKEEYDKFYDEIYPYGGWKTEKPEVLTDDYKDYYGPVQGGEDMDREYKKLIAEGPNENAFIDFIEEAKQRIEEKLKKE